MITMSIKQAKFLIDEWKANESPVYLTSGGFDPMHIGHLRCIQQTAILAGEVGGKTVVVVNGDGFLERKKGNAFMPCVERCEITAGIRKILSIVHNDGSQTVVGAIAELKPDFFTKGGDRDDPTVIPEWSICQEINCEVVFGVGGGKVQSSSWLTKNYSG